MSFDISEAETNQKRWRIVGGIFLVVIGFYLVFSLRDCLSPPNSYERQLEQSSGHQHVDRLCASLPLPEGVRIVSRRVGGNTFTDSVTWELSPDPGIDNLTDFYGNWFEAAAWHRSQSRNEVISQKEKQRVNIESLGGTFAISCSEEH